VIDQIGIVAFGSTAVFLTQSKRESWRRSACLFGSAAQPFWFWTLAGHHQFGIMMMSCLYTFSWFKGVWQWWIQPYFLGKTS